VPNFALPLSTLANFHHALPGFGFEAKSTPTRIYSGYKTFLAAKKRVARPVLNAAVFAIADGEKIQIGEQLDWRVTSERTGGNRLGWASRAAILGLEKRGRHSLTWPRKNKKQTALACTSD
jgi:hypothetical protein